MEFVSGLDLDINSARNFRNSQNKGLFNRWKLYK
jgi:hypothetical protein